MVGTLFNSNTVDCHEYAKCFIESIVRVFSVHPNDENFDPLDQAKRSAFETSNNFVLNKAGLE